MDQTAFIALLVFIVPMCFTPGPNNMLCAAHGSQHGFRATVPLTLGMVVGWSVLGLAVGSATLAIESNISVFEALTYVGAAYIAYLGITLARSPVKPAGEASETERLGFFTGAMLQLVNGKAWVHFLNQWMGFKTFRDFHSVRTQQWHSNVEGSHTSFKEIAIVWVGATAEMNFASENL